MPDDDESRTVPLVAERAHLEKHEVVTDRLRVTTSIDERAVLVEDVVERGSLKVRRVPTDREVEAAPEPRHEGDTLILSVVEERLVVEKRLFVVEEVHITRVSTSEHVAVPETLRTMRATVERASTENLEEGETGG